MTAPNQMLKSSLVVSAATMLSRVLGLVRDVVMANLLGGSNAADAFYVAFKIPNFFRRLFAEGAFAQAFVPVLSDYREQGGLAAVEALIHRVFAWLGTTLFAICVLAWVFAPALTWIFASGFHQYPDKLALTTELIRWTFPYLGFISLTAFAGAILNTFGYFAVPALTPILLNVSLIGAALGLTPFVDSPAHALAMGVLLAGALQLLFQVPFLWRLGLLPRPIWERHHPGVRRILLLMAPALFAVSVSQINLLLDTVLASWLVTGSIAWLYYADRLLELPLGVIGIALATVVLPTLSGLSARDDRQAFRASLSWAVRMVLLLGIPAALALWLLATPIISTLFYHGAMTAHDVQQSAAALQAYAPGLVAFMLVKVLAPGFFSREDMKTPVRIAVVALVANMILNLMLIWSLAHVGLALATTLSAWLNASLLAWGLSRAGYFSWRDTLWQPRTLAVGVAVLLMAAALGWLMPEVEVWLSAELAQRVIWLSGLIALGLVVYLSMLWVLGWRWRHIRGE